MKFSAQEEYGLRILIQIARHDARGGLTIPQIAELEGLTESNVAKLTRLLRMAGYLESTRGQEGGYTLARSPETIIVGEVLSNLGGRLFDDAFCDKHAGFADICSHSVDCSVRSVWQTVQAAVDQVLDRLTLKDLAGQTLPVSVKIPASLAR